MSISNHLNKIKNAIYGKDVRGAIHDAIKQCYDDASINHDNANMEVKLARGHHNTLNDRLNKSDQTLAETSAQLDTISIEISKEKKESLLREKASILAQIEVLKQSEILINTNELIDIITSESDYISAVDSLIKLIESLLGKGDESNGTVSSEFNHHY